MNPKLAEIARQIKERDYPAARAGLRIYLNENPNDAQGWYMLAFAESDRDKRIAHLKRALKIQPDYAKAREQLEKLQMAAPASGKSRRWLLLTAPILGIVAVAVVLLATMNRPAGEVTLPTLVSTNESASENTQVAEAATVEQNTPIATDEALSPTATLNSEASAAPTDNPTVTVAITNTTVIIATATTETVAAVNANPTEVTQQEAAQIVLPQAPTNTLAPSPTPTNPPPAGATAVPPTVPVSGDTGIPVNTEMNIGTGKMRVIAVTRPGSSYITELGGKLVNPPSGQEWVVLEVMIICTGNINCAPELSALKIVDSSGTSYNPSPNFNVPLPFNTSAYAVGQVWGYMGFTVPTTETTLRLILTQSGQNYTFALQ